MTIHVPPKRHGIKASFEHGTSADIEALPDVNSSPDATSIDVHSLPDTSALPDVRDGLTREERTVLWVLDEAQKERGGRSVPTTMLWGRVCEHFYITPENLSEMLARLGARNPR